MRFREAKQLSQGPTVRKWQGRAPRAPAGKLPPSNSPGVAAPKSRAMGEPSLPRAGQRQVPDETLGP